MATLGFDAMDGALLRGEGRNADPLIALGDGLNQLLKAMVAAGFGPHHMSAMRWTSGAAAALHPSRRAVDRARREVLAGFCPPLDIINQGAADTMIVEARLNKPASPPSDAPVYQGYNVMELARQMSPRNQVADMLALFRQWTRDGEQARARLAGQGAALDVRYGAHRENILDLYLPPGVKNPPLWVFIHGGYWQASSKDQHAQYFDAMLAAGFAVANIDYPLAPETPLTRIVDHVREALIFLVREQAILGVDASNMHVCGHSAGGHLAAFVAADMKAPLVRSSLPLSGIFDLEALRLIPMGMVLGLDSRQTAQAISPLFMTPRTGMRTAMALGALESDEFKRQSAALASAWNAPAPLHLAGAHHFSLLDGLLEGPLLDLAKSLARQ